MHLPVLLYTDTLLLDTLRFTTVVVHSITQFHVHEYHYLSCICLLTGAHINRIRVYNIVHDTIVFCPTSSNSLQVRSMMKYLM